MARQDYSWIGTLEPRRVLEFFSDISAIPRETGNLEQISSAVESWIRGMGLKVVRDRFCNVKAFKPASPGYESAPAVMLTAHLDMVCVKVPGSEHDFKKDPIRIIVQNGDTIKADGTTLGADDAIGAAMILAVLESKVLRHPALEAVFTADEETDMSGALNMDYGDLKSTLILNLDSPALGIAGAGQLDVRMKLRWLPVPVKAGYIPCEIEIYGLQGGHSGDEATKERGNAVALLNRVLMAFEKRMDLQLLQIQGGSGMSTAFASHATAKVAIASDAVDEAAEIVRKLQDEFKTELQLRDPGVRVAFRRTEGAECMAADRHASHRLIQLLAALPDGVFSMNLAYPGLMESCVNIGVVEMGKNDFVVVATIRSIIESKKYYLFDRIMLICEALGVESSVDYDLPQWDMKLSSETLALAKSVYSDCPLLVEQGTNECGVFCDRMPEASVISVLFGISGAHSVNECISARECELYYKRLVELLEKLKK